jgi:uncharacterized protein YukJ
MPLKRYGVLKGTAIDRRLGAGQSPHYQVHIVDEQLDHRIAVNVKSALTPSTLEYLVVEDFRHPITQGLAELSPGFHPLPSGPGGLALDFIRGNLFDPRDMRTLPHDVPGPDNDLNEKIDHFVQRAMSAEEAEVYAFGEKWGPEDKKDKYFGFRPGAGIHDIHMNQGNVERFRRDDGVWQDGGLLFHFPGEGRWVGIFLKFQSQSWHTDDRTGHRIDAGLPDLRMRIVAALVNPVGPSPEAEQVIVLNTTPAAIDLHGWSVANKDKRRMPLEGTIGPGETTTFAMSADVPLSNKGGIITLLDAEGLKVHGVAYTAAQAAVEGTTIVF